MFRRGDVVRLSEEGVKVKGIRYKYCTGTVEKVDDSSVNILAYVRWPDGRLVGYFQTRLDPHLIDLKEEDFL